MVPQNGKKTVFTPEKCELSVQAHMPNKPIKSGKISTGKKEYDLGIVIWHCP